MKKNSMEACEATCWWACKGVINMQIIDMMGPNDSSRDAQSIVSETS